MVEVLIAVAIILVSVMSLVGVHSLYLKTALSNAEGAKAAFLAEEGLEVVRFWRDASWNNNILGLALGTEYGLLFSGGSWATSTEDFAVESFERSITLSAVYRDASSGDIVTSGGTLDPEARLVESKVSWDKSGVPTTRTISTYITNLFEIEE